MYVALEILTLVLVSVAFALALAHALELPGKMRLSRAQYLTVQPIYYPGFTVGGAAEPLGLIAACVLLALTSAVSLAFWLIAGTVVALLAMHAAYWLFTHPVNRFWLKETEMTAAGGQFFSTGAEGPTRVASHSRWRDLRDRWEYSHVLRAALGGLGLISLAAAVAA